MRRHASPDDTAAQQHAVDSCGGAGVADERTTRLALPTTIRATIRALRSLEGNCRIVIVLELRSNTMRMGLHRDSLKKALSEADLICMLGSDDLAWNPESALASLGAKFSVTCSVNEMLGVLLEELKSGDHVVMMSNGGFQGLPRLLQQSLKNQDSESVQV